MATKLRIGLAENLGLIPPVLGYLASVTKVTDGYRYYRVRHPGGIFNLQLGEVASSLLNLTIHVNSSAPNTPLENKELLRKLRDALFSFTNYYNAAYDILLGCCKVEESRPEKDVWRWLKAHGYSAEGVYRSGLSEAKFFLDIFNELKHSSKQFGAVTLIRMRDGVRVSGYYLECVDETGVIIPDPLYHGNDTAERGANSFSFDLRRLYYLIYKVSDVLLAALKHQFREVYSTELPFDSQHSADSKHMDDLYEAISQLPDVFFPNEYRKAVPLPRIAGKGEHRALVFENHKIPDQRGARDTYEVNAILPLADGFSRSWGLPYHRKL